MLLALPFTKPLLPACKCMHQRQQQQGLHGMCTSVQTRNTRKYKGCIPNREEVGFPSRPFECRVLLSTYHEYTSSGSITAVMVSQRSYFRPLLLLPLLCAHAQ